MGGSTNDLLEIVSSVLTGAKNGIQTHIKQFTILLHYRCAILAKWQGYLVLIQVLRGQSPVHYLYAISLYMLYLLIKMDAYSHQIFL